MHYRTTDNNYSLQTIVHVNDVLFPRFVIKDMWELHGASRDSVVAEVLDPSQKGLGFNPPMPAA